MYGKIFDDIFGSSLMVHGGDTVYVFIAMIVLSDDEGFLREHPAAFANRIGKDFETVKKAISHLEAADSESSTPDYDGRRIIPLRELTGGTENRGWFVVNKKKYRELAKREDRKHATNERVRRFRERNASVTPSNAKETLGNDEKRFLGHTDTHTDVDTDSGLPSPNGEGVSGVAAAACPHLKIIELYHDILPMCPRVKPDTWTKTRAAKLRTRWHENKKRQNLEWWERYFRYVAKSKFLTGQAPARNKDSTPFLANLEWLISPSNMAKVIEGHYHR